MTRSLMTTTALGLVLLALAAHRAGAQALEEATVGFREPREAPATATAAMHGREAPTVRTLYLLTVGTSALGALLGGALGQGFDESRCKRENPERTPQLFDDPCFIPVRDGAAVGWASGATLGATVAAAAGARRRGCPWPKATMRALAGAAAGSAPGLVVVAAKPGSYRGMRAALVMTTPLLAGVGSAAAVARCRG